MKKIDDYIRKCVHSTYEFKEKRYEQSLISWFYVIIDDEMVYKINTPYSSINKIVTERLNRTIGKYFGLKMSERYYFSDMLDVNRTHNKIASRGKEFYLCDKESEYIYDKLVAEYYEISADEAKQHKSEYRLPSDLYWDTYRYLYKRAIGNYPNIEIKDKSFNVKEII